MKKTSVVATATGFAAALVLAGCGSTAGNGGSAAASDNMSGMAGMSMGSGSTSAPAPAAIGNTVNADLDEFHIALSKTKLTPGTWTFAIRNTGKITHALTVDGKGVDNKSSKDINGGQTTTLTVTLAAGKYEVYCPVGDHKMEGMDTTVEVG